MEYSVDGNSWTATTLSLADVPVGNGTVKIFGPRMRVRVTAATGTGKVRYLLNGYRGDYKFTASTTGGSGAGDLVGPNAATDGAPAVYDGVTGKLVKDSARSGNTLEFATVAGAKIASGCVEYDANGNITTSGDPCGTGGGTALPCAPSYTSATVIEIASCKFGVGNNTFPTVAACATSAVPASSGTLFVYIAKDGTPTLGYSGTNTTGCTGWTPEQSVVGYPDDALQIGTFTWAAGAWSSTVLDHRVALKRDVYEFSNGIECTTTLGVTSCVAEVPIATAQAGTPWTINDSTSSTTNYAGCPATVVSAYAAGQWFWFKPANTNTGSSQIDICTLGNKTIQKLVSGTLTNLASGDMDSDAYHLITYNGTVFIKSPLEGSSGGGITPATRSILSSRPTCDGSISGQLWYPDSGNGIGLSSHCNGTAWQDYFANVPITRPTNAASWTQVNSPGSLVDDNGFLTLTKSTTGLGLALKTIATPSSAFTYIVGFIYPGGMTGDRGDCGIYITTGTNPASSVASGLTVGPNAQKALQYYTRRFPTIGGGIDNWGPSLNQAAIPTAGGAFWIKLTGTPTNGQAYVGNGPNGTWIPMGAVGTFNLGTDPTYYGFGCDPRSTEAAMITIIHESFVQ